MVLSRNLPTDDQLKNNETLSENKLIFFNWRLLFAVAMITMNFSLGIVSSLHRNVLLAQKILFSTQIHVTFLQFLPQIQAGIIQNSNIRKILSVCLWEDRIVSIPERHLQKQNHILVRFWKTNVIRFFNAKSNFWWKQPLDRGEVKINKHLWNNFELWF